jgi:hypothetical protein
MLVRYLLSANNDVKQKINHKEILNRIRHVIRVNTMSKSFIYSKAARHFVLNSSKKKQVIRPLNTK